MATAMRAPGGGLDPAPPPTATAAPASDRLERLRADLEAVGVHDPVADRERLLGRLGAVLLVLGPIWVAVEYLVSHSGQNSLQQRDAIIGALFGLSLSLAGVALFLRYSGGRLLKLWMARAALMADRQQAELVAAVRDRDHPI